MEFIIIFMEEKNVEKGKTNLEKDISKNRTLVDEGGRINLSNNQDNQGRTLSKQQQEYFKDSKVRDENGNLLTMYHGTPNGSHNEFNEGTYFTSRKGYAAKIVHDITAILLEKGYIPVLYTDQNYPNSNKAYFNAGYENSGTLVNFSCNKELEK